VGSVIGALLPLGLVVAISPSILTVLIVLLLGADTGSAIGFSLGYTVGLAADILLFLLLGGLAGLNLRPNWSTTQGWILVLIGFGLAALGIRQFHHRRRPDDPPPPRPRWMAAVSGVGTLRAGLIGTGLGALRPKNLLMVAAASVVIVAGGLSSVETVIAIVLFVALSASTVLGVTAIAVLDRERMVPRLISWQAALELHAAAVMSVVLLVVGVAVFGQGLGVVTS
jgi:hypothetical protein